MTAKLAAFEQDLQGFLKGEGERTSNAARVLLTLEIANLKRAMDRGDRYAAELDAVRKAGGATLKLAPLERYSLEGAPALPDARQGVPPRRQCRHRCGGRAGRRLRARPPGVGRPLDRARAQGRPRSRRREH